MGPRKDGLKAGEKLSRERPVLGYSVNEAKQGKFSRLREAPGKLRREPLASRVLAGLGALLLIMLIGFSRIYLGVHFPTDVLAGWCIGIAWALICGAIMSRFQRSGTVEPAED